MFYELRNKIIYKAYLINLTFLGPLSKKVLREGFRVSKRTVTSEIANPVLKGPLSILCVFECFLRLGKFLKRVPIHHKKKCRSSYEACIFRMREKNYASFLGAVFFTVFGRDLPWLPKIILPRLVLLSPLPIVAFFFLMKNFKKIID